MCVHCFTAHAGNLAYPTELHSNRKRQRPHLPRHAAAVQTLHPHLHVSCVAPLANVLVVHSSCPRCFACNLTAVAFGAEWLSAASSFPSPVESAELDQIRRIRSVVWPSPSVVIPRINMFLNRARLAGEALLLCCLVVLSPMAFCRSLVKPRACSLWRSRGDSSGAHCVHDVPVQRQAQPHCERVSPGSTATDTGCVD